MTREEWIARWIAALGGLSGKLEEWKAKYPDIAPEVDPIIVELRATMDAAIISNAVGAGLSELQRLLETMQLDPRFKRQDLA